MKNLHVFPGVKIGGLELLHDLAENVKLGNPQWIMEEEVQEKGIEEGVYIEYCLCHLRPRTIVFIRQGDGDMYMYRVIEEVEQG